MKIFVKAGRPSKEEKELAEKIEKIFLDAQASGNKELVDAIEGKGAVYNLDGLKKMMSIIESKNFSGKKIKVENNNIKSDNMAIKNEGENTSSPNQEKLHGDEVKFEDVLNISEDSQFQQPPIERESAYGKYANSGEGASVEGGGGGNEPPVEGEEPFEEPKDSGEGGGGEGGEGGGGDIPDHTKNLSNSKLAKVAADVYEKILPILPRRIAKISDTKIEKMERYDEIDTSMKLQLPEGGTTTIKQYLEFYNAQLDAQIQVTPEMKKDFQGALKDMMNEKKVAATPTEVFVGTVVSQLAILGITAAEQMAAMNRNLKFWKEVHEENKKNNNPVHHQQVKRQPPPSAEPPVEKSEPVNKPSPTSSSGASMPSSETKDDGIQSESEEITINPEQAQVK